MRKMSGESWLVLIKGRRRKNAAKTGERLKIDVLTFEVSSHMSRAVHLWHSLSQDQILRLKDEILRLEGVRKLVSNDDNLLLGLALAETMDSVDSLAHFVRRLSKRCADPGLRRFDQAFVDMIASGSDPHGFLCSGKKMERKVKKFKRFVAAGASLYQEIGILGELEEGLRRMESKGSNFIDLKQKVVWQREAVKCLRDSSVWNRSYDYTARLLADSLFTIVDRIKLVFGFQHDVDVDDDDDDDHDDVFSKKMNQFSRSRSVNNVMQFSSVSGGVFDGFGSGAIERLGGGWRRGGLLRSPARIRWPVSTKSFKGWMIGRDINRPNNSRNGAEDVEPELPADIFNANLLPPIFKSRRKLLTAPPSTLGAAALSLHYANLIILIEKLASSPHLISNDARDDLYGMLPTSIRMALRIRLKSYAKNLSLSVYDPNLAADWTDAMCNIFEWLSPLAHNMIKWQSDRNFEQHHLVTSNNVLLLQTLYYANQGKTEAAITELLVGMNYLWRYAKEINEKVVLDDCLGNNSMI